MIRFKHKGDFSKTLKYLNKTKNYSPSKVLEIYAKQGVYALSSATPIDSGNTAAAWSYEIVKSSGGYKIVWSNSNVVNGVNIAVILQYGHGTGEGGYVEGRDYINPAIRPIFDRIAERAWEEVRNG